MGYYSYSCLSAAHSFRTVIELTGATLLHGLNAHHPANQNTVFRQICHGINKCIHMMTSIYFSLAMTWRNIQGLFSPPIRRSWDGLWIHRDPDWDKALTDWLINERAFSRAYVFRFFLRAAASSLGLLVWRTCMCSWQMLRPSLGLAAQSNQLEIQWNLTFK